MIRNDEEFAVVRRQLALIEDALVDLRREVLPRNRANYEVLAEGYVDQIELLRAEINTYLGMGLEPVHDQPAGPANFAAKPVSKPETEREPVANR
jgi:hypothetical protein